MTNMPAREALRPRQDLPGPAPVPALYAFDEPCTVLLGWQRREADALRRQLGLPDVPLEDLRRRDDALDVIAVLGGDA